MNNIDSDKFFWIQKLLQEFPEDFPGNTNFDEFPYDNFGTQYTSWEEVYNNILALNEDKYFKSLPRDTFNFLVLFNPLEDLENFLEKVCRHKPSYCSENAAFWKLLWLRDLNDFPPPKGIKEKYLKFIRKFNGITNIQQKFILAIKKGALNQLKDLINKGANLFAKNNVVIQLAAKNGRLEILKYLLHLGSTLNENFIINALSADDYTTIYLAVVHGQLEVLKYLLSLDENFIINILSSSLNNIIIKTAGNGHLEMVRFLADLTPKQVKTENYKALASAAENGHLEVVRFLTNLGPEGVKANNYYVRGTAGYEFPPLRYAAYYGHLEVVHFLVDLDPKGIKANDYDLFRLAAAKGHLEVVRLLADLDPEGIKANSYAPLFNAAANGHLEVVRLLANLGPEGIKANNYKALHLAAYHGHLEVTQFLLSKIENLSEISDYIKILIKDRFNIFI